MFQDHHLQQRGRRNIDIISNSNINAIGSSNSSLVHNVNPGSYVSREDRAYFEYILEEEVAAKDKMILECKDEILSLKRTIKNNMEHTRLMEKINNDLESRLEKIAIEKTN